MSSTGGEGSSPTRKVQAPRDAHLVHLLAMLSLFFLSLTSRRVRSCGRGKEKENGVEVMEGEEDLGNLYGAEAGWVEARTSCPHLPSMPAADDLARVPPHDSPCSRFVWSSLEFSCSSVSMID
jgi:hypothetical protein